MPPANVEIEVADREMSEPEAEKLPPADTKKKFVPVLVLSAIGDPAVPFGTMKRYPPIVDEAVTPFISKVA
jgi:hypothetical protein